MIKKILLGLATAITLLAVVIALRPAEYRYTRSVTIAAPPDVLFAKVNDLRAFGTWNPWAKLDPNIVLTYSGPPAGVGSAYTWQGNHEVGAGSMTITESKPGELVRARMDFREPFAGTSTAEFTFQPAPGGTSVSWSMSGSNNFVGKAMSLCIDCDKMIGSQFEKGLADLKSQSETHTTP